MDSWTDLWGMMPNALDDSLRSSHREALLEHLFAGEVMKRLWLRDN